MPNSSLIALAIGVLLGVALLPYVPLVNTRDSESWLEDPSELWDMMLFRYEPASEHEQLRFE